MFCFLLLRLACGVLSQQVVLWKPSPAAPGQAGRHRCSSHWLYWFYWFYWCEWTQSHGLPVSMVAGCRDQQLA